MGRLYKLPARLPDVPAQADTGDDVMYPYLHLHLQYLTELGYSATTIYARRRALIRILKLTGHTTLLDVTAAELREWRAGLQVDAETIGDYVSHLRRFYAWAIEEELCWDDPARKLTVPRRTRRRVARPIDEQLLLMALAGAPPRIRPWIVLAAWCGLRAKEIALLRRENVLDTAAEPALLIASDATKGLNERLVPLCSFARGELYSYGLPVSGYVFRRRDGRPGPNRPSTISKLTNSYLHEIGIAATIHQMRHRFATRYYEIDQDPRALQEILGHLDPASTAIYTDYSRPKAAAAVEKLPVPGRLHIVSRKQKRG